MGAMQSKHADSDGIVWLVNPKQLMKVGVQAVTELSDVVLERQEVTEY